MKIWIANGSGANLRFLLAENETSERGKGSKIMAIADRQGLPIAVHVESATPHEVTLVRHSRHAGL